MVKIINFEKKHFYPFPKQALVFKCLQYKSFENTIGKEEIAGNKQFPFSNNVFYPFGEPSAIFFKSEFAKICCLGESYIRD